MNSTLCRSWTIALAVVAVAASAVADDLRPTRIETNEAAAIASLREIAAAQTKFQASGVCDVNSNGVGEFGLLREMSGAVGVRTNLIGSTVGASLDPPLLSNAYRKSDDGDVHAGYRLLVILPGAVGIGSPEVSTGPVLAIDSDLAETTWGCYAWPAQYGVSGRRTFFVNQTGDIVATDSKRYSGGDALAPQNAGAAFPAGGYPQVILGPVAVGTVGTDGNFWRAVDSRSSDVEQSVCGRLAAVSSTSGVTGTFEITSRRLTTSTSETIVVRATHVDPRSDLRVALVDAAGATTAEFAEPPVRARPTGRIASHFDSASQSYPDGITTLTSFGGGTVELRVDGVAVARGAIPAFVTPTGSSAPNAFARWRGRSTLSPMFPGDPGRGTVTAELTNEPRGTRQRLVVEVTGLRFVPPPWRFFAGNEFDYSFLATIASTTRHGGSSRILDSRRHSDFAVEGLVALSGAPMSLRSPGGLVLTGTFPVVESP